MLLPMMFTVAFGGTPNSLAGFTVGSAFSGAPGFKRTSTGYVGTGTVAGESAEVTLLMCGGKITHINFQAVFTVRPGGDGVATRTVVDPVASAHAFTQKLADGLAAKGYEMRFMSGTFAPGREFGSTWELDHFRTLGAACEGSSCAAFLLAGGPILTCTAGL